MSGTTGFNFRTTIDLTPSISFNVILYADDSTVIVRTNNLRNLQKLAEHTMVVLTGWFTANGLKLISKKLRLLNFKLDKVGRW